MASFASSATTGGARKHAWTKRGQKVRRTDQELISSVAQLSTACSSLSILIMKLT